MIASAQLLSWIGSRIGKPPGWERVVRRLAPLRSCEKLGEVCLLRDGVAFLARPAVPIGWNVTFFGSYEPELREIFRSILRPGAIAVDVGANIGWHTLLMAQLVGEHGRVIAVEPNPSILRGLHQNVELNRFSQVEIVPCALADAEGVVSFYGPDADDAGSGNGHVVGEAMSRQEPTIDVEARRLDDVAAAAGLDRLDLIKIDVEGFEWPVLRGADQVIARFRPHIVFEFDIAYTPRGGGSAPLLDDFFRRHRYRLLAVRRSWAEPVSSSAWPNCANIWAAPLR